MNNINNQFPLTGLSTRQNSLPDSRSAGYVKEQSFKSHENLDTDLVIHTKEGDRVTLTSNSYSRMDAYTYDSKGMAQTESGTAAFSNSYREISLASGKSFSFTIEGDLNDDELKDLDNMLKGLDGIISDVTTGDMDEAVKGALGLGGYDSFSAFSVDINYQQYVEVTSTMAATSTETQRIPENSNGTENGQNPTLSQLFEGEEPHSKNKPMFLDFDKLFGKIIAQLDDHDEETVGFAKKPINSLFKHHLDEIKNGEDNVGPLSQVIEKAMEKTDSFIADMMARLIEGNGDI